MIVVKFAATPSTEAAATGAVAWETLPREAVDADATPVTSASPPLAQPSEPASSSSSTRRRRRRRVDSAVFASGASTRLSGAGASEAATPRASGVRRTRPTE